MQTSIPHSYGLNTGVTDPNLFGFPSIYESTSDMDPLGGNYSWPLWTTPSHTQNISDTVTYTKGKHSFKFGGIYTWGGVDYLRATEGRGEVDFHYLEDYIAGDRALLVFAIWESIQKCIHERLRTVCAGRLPNHAGT